MKINLNGKSSIPLDKLRADLPRRIENFGRAIAQDTCRRVAGTVADKIAGTGKWVSDYRGSIDYRETADGLQFAVAGLSDKPLFNVPAATSLITFTGTTPGGAILKAFEPMVVDLIPAFVFSEAYIPTENLAEEQVEAERARLASRIPEIAEALSNAGLKKSGSGFPEFSNGKLWDMKFMARAMELGFPGHQQYQHWLPGFWKAVDSLNMPTSRAKTAADGALAGADVPAERIMSELEAKKLANIRSETWA